MQLLLSLLSARIVVPILVFHGQALSVQGFRSSSPEIDINHAKRDEFLKNGGVRQIEATGQGLRSTETVIKMPTGADPEEDLSEDPDFQDEEDEELMNLEKENTPSVHSVTHLHHRNGEVLIPCFGMWWPVGGGGGGGAYYYGGDYYGDYRRKRRRSRKQKKAAKMKKKKA